MLIRTLLAAALLTTAACKKDNAKPDPSALKDAAATAVARPSDAAVGPSADASAATAVAADAGAKTAAASPDAGAKTGPADDKKPVNLKVLPKTWTSDKVTDYMKKQVSRGLGVKCDFCHVKGDFASDDNEHKVKARKMISLTDGINRDHFKKKPEVTCFTCHKGKEEVAP